MLKKFILALFVVLLMFVASEAKGKKYTCNDHYRPTTCVGAPAGEVCGHKGIVCKKTFANACLACHDKHIKYIRPGPC